MTKAMWSAWAFAMVVGVASAGCASGVDQGEGNDPSATYASAGYTASATEHDRDIVVQVDSESGERVATLRYDRETRSGGIELARTSRSNPVRFDTEPTAHDLARVAIEIVAARPRASAPSAPGIRPREDGPFDPFIDLWCVTCYWNPQTQQVECHWVPWC